MKKKREGRTKGKSAGLDEVRWADHANCSLDPSVVDGIFRQIKARTGTLTNKAILDAARASSSPLHGHFEWDDQIAGEKYRLTQAGELKRTLVYVRRVEDDERERVTRAWLPVTRRDEGDDERRVTTWQPIEEAMADPEQRTEIIRRALAEARAWQQRYQDMRELSSVFAALDAVAS
jgi:hypothetical protein